MHITTNRSKQESLRAKGKSAALGEVSIAFIMAFPHKLRRI